MAQIGRILSFQHTRSLSKDWTQQELAEFYRVESALLQHGLMISAERGLSDEGHPWFVFCHCDSEEVIVHFARIDGQYVVSSSAFSGIARGRDFNLLIRELMASHPLMLPRGHGRDHKLFVHPAASLAALVATSYLISSERDSKIEDISAIAQDKGFKLQLYDFAILSAVVGAAATWAETLDPSQDSILSNIGSDEGHTVDLAAHTTGALFSEIAASHYDDIAMASTHDPVVHSLTSETSSQAKEVVVAPPVILASFAGESETDLGLLAVKPHGYTNSEDSATKPTYALDNTVDITALKDAAGVTLATDFNYEVTLKAVAVVSAPATLALDAFSNAGAVENETQQLLLQPLGGVAPMGGPAPVGSAAETSTPDSVDQKSSPASPEISLLTPLAEDIYSQGQEFSLLHHLDLARLELDAIIAQHWGPAPPLVAPTLPSSNPYSGSGNTQSPALSVGTALGPKVVDHVQFVQTTPNLQPSEGAISHPLVQNVAGSVTVASTSIPSQAFGLNVLLVGEATHVVVGIGPHVDTHFV